MTQGTIKRYDFKKGFGFITEEKSGTDFFFHKSEWRGDGPIRPAIQVTFNAKESEKGPQAELVTPTDGSTKTNASKSTSASKPRSLEARVSHLEASISTWKIISVLSFIIAATLVVDKITPIF